MLLKHLIFNFIIVSALSFHIYAMPRVYHPEIPYQENFESLMGRTVLVSQSRAGTHGGVNGGAFFLLSACRVNPGPTLMMT
jgi:hypothetical protein